MYCDYVRIEHDVTKSLNLMAILGTVTRPLHFDFCIFNFDKKIGSRIPCLLYNIKITILVPFGPHKLLKFLRYRFKEKSAYFRIRLGFILHTYINLPFRVAKMAPLGETHLLFNTLN